MTGGAVAIELALTKIPRNKSKRQETILQKFKLAGTTMANKQNQEAGDNSQQLQADQMIFNIGIDGKRAREICHKSLMEIKEL